MVDEKKMRVYIVANKIIDSFRQKLIEFEKCIISGAPCKEYDFLFSDDTRLTAKEIITYFYIISLAGDASENHNLIAFQKLSENNKNNKIIEDFHFENTIKILEMIKILKNNDYDFETPINAQYDFIEFSNDEKNQAVVSQIEFPDRSLRIASQLKVIKSLLKSPAKVKQDAERRARERKELEERREQQKQWIEENTDGSPTLIDKYEEDYRNALNSIETDVKQLVQSGQEMKGIMLFSDNISKILEVHDSLNTFYSNIYSHQSVLERFNSERIKQLGHEPVALYEQLKDLSYEPEVIDGVVVAKNIKVGEMAMPGMPAIILSDLSNLKISAEIAESLRSARTENVRLRHHRRGTARYRRQCARHDGLPVYVRPGPAQRRRNPRHLAQRIQLKTTHGKK